MGPPPEETQAARRRTQSRRGRLSADSPLLGGPLTSSAGAEEPRARPADFDPRADPLDIPRGGDGRAELPEPRLLRDLIPREDAGREVDDWGRSERVFQLVEPALNFYYRYWFRVEQEGIENIPSDGGALLVSNHSGALPPDAPMIMQAIR